MFQKFLNFIKYNNAALLILAVIFVIGASVFAAENPDTLGKKTTSVKGVDNALLLSADLDKMDMDFKIGKIEEDSTYYYVTFTYLDLDIVKNAWQYDLKEKTRKITKNRLENDLGAYLAGQFKNIHDARVKGLKGAKVLAQANGPEKRIEVTGYNGLIGKTLDLAAGIFPGYQSAKSRELPSPSAPDLRTLKESTDTSASDNLTKVYNDYVATHDLNLNNTETATGTDATDANPAATVIATGTPDSSNASGSVEIVN